MKEDKDGRYCEFVGWLIPGDATDSRGIRRSGYDIYIEDAGHDYPALYNKDIEISTTTMNKVVENLINQFPEHYMWGYKRFRGSKETDHIYKAD